MNQNCWRYIDIPVLSNMQLAQMLRLNTLQPNKVILLVSFGISGATCIFEEVIP